MEFSYVLQLLAKASKTARVGLLNYMILWYNMLDFFIVECCAFMLLILGLMQLTITLKHPHPSHARLKFDITFTYFSQFLWVLWICFQFTCIRLIRQPVHPNMRPSKYLKHHLWQPFTLICTSWVNMYVRTYICMYVCINMWDNREYSCAWLWSS